jgi:hypothetical protein
VCAKLRELGVVTGAAATYVYVGEAVRDLCGASLGQLRGLVFCTTTLKPSGQPPVSMLTSAAEAERACPAACCWAVAADSQQMATNHRAVVIIRVPMTVLSPAGSPQSPDRKVGWGCCVAQ